MLVDSNRFSCALIRPYGTGIVAKVPQGHSGKFQTMCSGPLIDCLEVDRNDPLRTTHRACAFDRSIELQQKRELSTSRTSTNR